MKKIILLIIVLSLFPRAVLADPELAPEGLFTLDNTKWVILGSPMFDIGFQDGSMYLCLLGECVPGGSYAGTIICSFGGGDYTVTIKGLAIVPLGIGSAVVCSTGCKRSLIIKTGGFSY